jgi:autotransporter-associated beta strand protein
LTKAGDGTLTLSGTGKTFSGGLVVDAGTVQTNTLGTALTIGGLDSGTNTLGSGNVTVNSGGTLTVTRSGNNGVTIASGGSLTNNGGTVSFTNTNTGGNNDFTINGTLANTAGTTTINTVGDDIIMGAAGQINVSGGTVAMTARDDFTTVSGSSIAVTGGTLNVNLTNASTNSTFTLASGATLTVDGAASAMTISAGADARPVNLDGRLNLHNGGTLTVTQGTTRLDSTTVFDGGTGATKGTLVLQGDLVVDNPLASNVPNITFNSDSNRSISAETGIRSLNDIGTVTKTGTGTLTIASNINNIEANTIVITQGTLLNGASDQISNDTNMVLGGGTYDTNGFDEILGTLTLTANSTIDLNDSGGGGDSILRFADSSAMAWVGGSNLQITGWTGLTTGGGTDQVYFGTSASGLTESQLSQIFFIDPAGFAPGTYGASILASGEIVPVPEPEVYAAMALLLFWLIWHERRRLRGAATWLLRSSPLGIR